MEEKKELSVAKVDNSKLSTSEKFTNKILKEFGGNVSGAMQVTDYQRTLIQGYFIGIDRALKKAEEERLKKNASNKDSKYNNDLPVVWNNVNLNDLALDVVHYARMGLDMMQDNHLFPIPYKNNKKSCYDITLMQGYNGIKYIAEKYAVTAPKSVTIEVVYSTDKFRQYKKCKGNETDCYEFEVTNSFDRGNVVGGFGYIEFEDPTKNKLIVMSLKDILKRKPKYASANFWGGTQKIWENGKQVEVESDGWFDKMVNKTLIREVYGSGNIPRDPKKIDDNYQYMKSREVQYAEIEAQAEIDTNANTVLIGQAPEPLKAEAEIENCVVDNGTGEVIGSDEAEQNHDSQPSF